jgi:hypothetical protein
LKKKLKKSIKKVKKSKKSKYKKIFLITHKDMQSTWVYAVVLAVIIIAFIVWLVTMQMEEFELQKDPKLDELRMILEPMFSRGSFNDPYLNSVYNGNKGNLLSNVSLYRGDKSYTINKSKIFLCLRDNEQEYYSNNMLLFVLLHEIAHVMCDEIGHVPKFHKIFDALIQEASKLGIYDTTIPVVQNYCDVENH